MLEESLNGGGGLITVSQPQKGPCCETDLNVSAAVYSVCGPEPEGWVRGRGADSEIRRRWNEVAACASHVHPHGKDTQVAIGFLGALREE